jgi:hypothetical protein
MLFFEDEGAPEYHPSEHHRAWKHQRSYFWILEMTKGARLLARPSSVPVAASLPSGKAGAPSINDFARH